MKTIARVNFREEDFLTKKDDLKKELGINKKFAKGYELPALLALTGYPELKDLEIEFKFVDSNTPFSSKARSVFSRAEKRTYEINICKNIKKGREDILPKNLPLNILVGLIAHEYAHIIDYLGKNSLQAISTGILYPLPSYKKGLERKIDSITVRRGFGHQLLEFASLIESLQEKYPEDKYYQSYFKYYLSPEEIKARISKDKVYQ